MRRNTEETEVLWVLIPWKGGVATSDEGQVSDEYKSRCTVIEEKYRDKSVFEPKKTGARAKGEM